MRLCRDTERIASTSEVKNLNPKFMIINKKECPVENMVTKFATNEELKNYEKKANLGLKTIYDF